MTVAMRMKIPVCVLSLFAISLALSPRLRAASTEPELITIGVLLAATSDGATEEIAAYRGAVLGLEEANVLAGFFGRRFELSVTRVKGAAEAAAEATRLIERNQALALISNLNQDAFLAVQSVVHEAEVLLLNCSTRADRLRTNSFPFSFHVEVSNRDYLFALGNYLVSGKNHRRWFLVRGDDSEGEQWEEMVRAYISGIGGEIAGVSTVSMKSEGECNNFDSEMLENSRASLVVVGLRGEQRSSFLKSFARLGISLPLALAHFGSDAQVEHMAWVGSGPVYWPSIWSRVLVRYSGRELNSRFHKRFNRWMDGDAWGNWAAVKLVAEAVIRTPRANGRSLRAYLERQPPFDGHKGAPLTFDLQRRQLRHTLYVLEMRAPLNEDIEDQLEVVSRFQMVSSDTNAGPIGVK